MKLGVWAPAFEISPQHTLTLSDLEQMQFVLLFDDFDLKRKSDFKEIEFVSLKLIRLFYGLH
jgi:hypothetical protein